MSVDPTLVAQLSGWLAATDIAVLELRSPDGTLRLVQAAGAIDCEPLVAPFAETPSGGTEIVAAPGVGIFLDRHPLRLEKLTGPGSRHGAGEPVGFLRVGPILKSVAAPCDCLIEEVLAAPGTTVGFGTPLFAVVPIAIEGTP